MFCVMSRIRGHTQPVTQSSRHIKDSRYLLHGQLLKYRVSTNCDDANSRSSHLGRLSVY